MFTVRITFFDCIDGYGYVSREFYALKKKDYKDNELVSVTADC